VRLHRNNAAEWAMVYALTPVFWAVRAWALLRRREKIRVYVLPRHLWPRSWRRHELRQRPLPPARHHH
jgi:hypothetical protein